MAVSRTARCSAAYAKKNAGVAAERLTDKHVARLVQKCVLKAGVRGDLPEGERKRAFAGHSLRAGLASSAQIEEAHVQKHLGHSSAEMTRRYQRKRDRFPPSQSYQGGGIVGVGKVFDINGENELILNS